MWIYNFECLILSEIVWEASLFGLALIHHLTICDQFCISLHRIHGSTIVYKAVKPLSTILFLLSNQRICPLFVLFGMELLLQEPHACLGSQTLRWFASLPLNARKHKHRLVMVPPSVQDHVRFWGSPPQYLSVGGGGVWLPTESQHIKLLKLQAVFLVLRHFLSLIQGRHQQAGQLTVCCEFQTSKHLTLSFFLGSKSANPSELHPPFYSIW